MPGLVARILLLSSLCCSPWLGAQTALTTPGKTLVYCVQQAPETLNPQLTVHNSTFDASARLLYDRLLAYKPGTTELAPGLAQS
ncbi:MAG: ABC transporter substrate-binding protein, partial [Candidatus Competibacteraceae bacterium]|nr:ABC transporter substrate-binding protein [Candidatus Competibacteraceae bacterium]